MTLRAVAHGNTRAAHATTCPVHFYDAVRGWHSWLAPAATPVPGSGPFRDRAAGWVVPPLGAPLITGMGRHTRVHSIELFLSYLWSRLLCLGVLWADIASELAFIQMCCVIGCAKGLTLCTPSLLVWAVLPFAALYAWLHPPLVRMLLLAFISTPLNHNCYRTSLNGGIPGYGMLEKRGAYVQVWLLQCGSRSIVAVNKNITKTKQKSLNCEINCCQLWQTLSITENKKTPKYNKHTENELTQSKSYT